MEFTIMKLKDIPFTILDKYKKEFTLPINAEVNSAIYIKPFDTDTNRQIHDMIKLIGMTKIALVILDIDHLFVKEEEDWSVYGVYEPARNLWIRKIILTVRATLNVKVAVCFSKSLSSLIRGSFYQN